MSHAVVSAKGLRDTSSMWIELMELPGDTKGAAGEVERYSC